ncbi:hypothetical protein B0A50_05957 [Salinomyces thailandicus]|uniref:Pkr1-domain-containing protein n=1 Tax=Salinomyces thailandicus TaxID=706561 RepID=A0A4U0TQ23_9PEZI|nr:hypothetical protein B0A50_05957 [Salinomyces thailandica]
MAAFMENLWSAVFTPGPTPALVVATNVTFAALQMLLGALFIATYSIHFVILSVLCAGLWWSINWFAAELRSAQLKEEEAERLRKQKKGVPKAQQDWKQTGEVGDSGADDEGGETETEDPRLRESASSVSYEATEEDERIRGEIMNAIKVSGSGGKAGGAASGLQADAGADGSRQRKVEVDDRSGDASSSTDSEWEKVEGDR